jgi:hypothetical protein
MMQTDKAKKVSLFQIRKSSKIKPQNERLHHKITAKPDSMHLSTNKAYCLRNKIKHTVTEFQEAGM